VKEIAVVDNFIEQQSNEREGEVAVVRGIALIIGIGSLIEAGILDDKQDEWKRDLPTCSPTLESVQDKERDLQNVY